MGFTAPEVLENQLNGDSTAMDIWSAAIIIYLLLSGKMPEFDRQNNFQVKFDAPIWNKRSEDSKSLIKNMLNRDPKQRPSAKQACQYLWLAERQWMAKATDENLCLLLQQFH